MCFKLFKKKEDPHPDPVVIPDIPSPQDWIDQDRISYQDHDGSLRVEGILPDVWITDVTDTNSMDGMVDAGHSLICSNHPNYLNNVAVGDVIIFEKYIPDYHLIAHRIVWSGWDAKGRFFKTKGDNFPEEDWYKVRKEDLRWVILGVIY